MPIYEFSCGKCGRNFEELAGRDEQVACPHCGASETHRLMSCCARRPRAGASDNYTAPSSGGCGGCSGGNCSSCGH